MELSKHYDQKEAEPRIQKFWEKNKVYKFNQKSKAKIYSIDTPPPTVSGKMHIGHAASYSQEDFIVRFKRMRGFNVFYPFGTDDNGLPTERLIEKEKGVKATKMSRQDFIRLCSTTLEKELRPKYLEDWKRVGMSCDWDLLYSTIDKNVQKLSQESFIDLYNKKKEYRKRTPFMWCPECQTAIAQVELEDKEKSSQFVYMKFDTSVGEQLTIATTRPELLPACVGISVHPNDKRYKKFVGETAKLPFFNREIKIQADEDVDPEFGSGVLYRCTFGGMEDAEWVNKNKIIPIEILNKDGTLNEQGGKYQGLSTKEARKEIIKDLEEEGGLEKVEPIQHVVNVHERCGTEIEILMTDQWFIKYLDLKKEFLKIGNNLNWHPKHMKNRYDNWVKGLKYDWCISRQRFFGVPFPVWYCKKCGEIILADKKDLPVDPLKDSPQIKSCPKCKSKSFEPEKDVLDTWATSSLTPQIAASLVPKIYDKIYPMDLRPQAHDIITFWLFNTVVKSYLHNKKIPWKDIIISGWVLDPHGKKMSKSKGNIIEPQEMIEKYSADSLRFWAASSKLGEDIPFQEKELIAGQKTITKLWNSSKFALMHLKNYKPKKVKLHAFDIWQLSKLNNLIKTCTESFENYEYFKTKSETENFFWHTFCDNYLEIIKNRLYNGSKNEKASAQYVLYQSLLTILKLFAPIMPHITEEIYQIYFRKHENPKSIHISEWPKADAKLINKKLEKEGDELIELISKVRQFKTSNKKPLKEEVILTLPNKFKNSEFLQDIKSVTNAKEMKFSHKLKVEF